MSPIEYDMKCVKCGAGGLLADHSVILCNACGHQERNQFSEEIALKSTIDANGTTIRDGDWVMAMGLFGEFYGIVTRIWEGPLRGGEISASVRVAGYKMTPNKMRKINQPSTYVVAELNDAYAERYFEQLGDWPKREVT
jgi:hypothetical protein